MTILLPVTILVIVFLIIFVLRGRMRARVRDGVPAVAQVLEIHQTGLIVNQVPMMEMRLRVEQASLPTREISIKQLVQLGEMPRAGEQVFVLLDPKDPTKAIYSGLVSGMTGQPGEKQGNGLDVNQTRDLIAVAPDLRENGRLGVGTIKALEPLGGMSRVTVEVDSVAEPRYTLSFDQTMTGFDYSVGDRAYLLIGKTDRNSVALMPLSMSGGQKLQPTANRLDPLVLGPEMLKAGRKGEGTVIECHRIAMSNAVLEAQGMQRWELRLEIVPEDGTARYEANQNVTFTTAEKVARICVVGAKVPIRYDANDPQTFATDTIAMGYPDPYAAVMASLGASG